MTQASYDAVNNIGNYTPAALDQMTRLMGSQNFGNGLENINTQNPYTAQYAQMSTQANPYQASTQANPFMQGFQNYDAQQNQYLDSMYDQGAAKIQDSLNSQFAGRADSAYHQKNMGDALGNFATNLYGQAADSMANRALQAQGMGSSAFTQGQGQSLQATGMNQNIFNSDFSNQLEAANAGSNAFQQGFNNQFDIANAQNDLYQQNFQNQYNAASAIPGMNNSQYQGALVQNQLGQQQDNLNNPWENIQNYANIVATMNGTQPQPRNSASNTDKMLGLLGLASSFFPVPKPNAIGW